jgi:site-specific DNA recombinase
MAPVLSDDVRVGIYVRRFPDDAQDNQLTTYIESQPGWRLVKRFPDDASGASTDRPGLKQAITAAKAGLIDVLLVYPRGSPLAEQA